jgi:hypothetical protein
MVAPVIGRVGEGFRMPGGGVAAQQVPSRGVARTALVTETLSRITNGVQFSPLPVVATAGIAPPTHDHVVRGPGGRT